jgi:hypothetical protein
MEKTHCVLYAHPCNHCLVGFNHYDVRSGRGSGGEMTLGYKKKDQQGSIIYRLSFAGGLNRHFIFSHTLCPAGVHYRPVEKWLLQLGFAYDTSPVDSDDRTPDMPIDRQIRYATGGPVPVERSALNRSAVRICRLRQGQNR